MRTAILLAVFVICVRAALGFSDVEGQLTANTGSLPSELSVELHQGGRLVERVWATPNGAFRIRTADTGNYEVRVLDAHGELLRRDFITVGSHMGPIQLRLDGKKKERPSEGSVSLRSLMKPVPKNVQKHLRRSEDALRKGNADDSFAHLQKALDECTDCPEVHNNIGVRHMKQGKVADAVASFRRAVELDPHSALATADLAIALAGVRDYPAAESTARQALALDRSALPARYALGLSLVARGQCTPEAVQHLTASAERIARARLSAAAALECSGDRAGAAEQVSAYLNGSAVEQRPAVEQWLTRLRSSR